MSNPMQRDEDEMRRLLDEDEHKQCDRNHRLSDRTITRLLRKVDEKNLEIAKLKKQLKETNE